MTVDEAVNILNERKHRQRSDWQVSGEWVVSGEQYDVLDEFEAVAIAEKYERAAES